MRTVVENKYKLSFYQCGVDQLPDEFYPTRVQAIREASDWLNTFRGMPGHRRTGSLHRDGFARYVDGFGATECAATVARVGQIT